MSGPRVSVMMPCYNARGSLPWALGSMLAQTFEDWELVLVDDGSSDHPEEIVERAADSRIRLIRLPENRGRGFARQVALDNARGKFIAMLDADDWTYPERLDHQIDVLRHEPTLALVSAGMAIVDCHNELVGVRLTGDGQVRGPHRGIICPVAHASSMYRRDAVGDVAFDPSLRLSEDQDFLLRMLQGQRFLILPEPLYVYAEFGSVSARKAAAGQRQTRLTLRKHIRSFPREASRAIAASFAKEVVYQGAAVFRLDRQAIDRRSQPPTDIERESFLAARATVALVAKHLETR